MVLERDFQAWLIKELKKRLPGCYVLKLDSGYLQGIPDLLILFEDRWAILEVKRKRPTKPSDFETNQEWYLEQFNEMSFADCVYPENVEEVLNGVQHALQANRRSRIPQR